jgi:hypothetical protein
MTAPTAPSLAEQLAAHLRVHRDDELDIPDIALKWRVPAHTVDAQLAEGVAAGLFMRIARKYKDPFYAAGPRLHLTPAPAPAAAPVTPGKRSRKPLKAPDPRAVQVFRGAPIPVQGNSRRPTSPYLQLLDRMEPGDTERNARTAYLQDGFGVELEERRYRTVEAHGTEFAHVGKDAAGRLLDGVEHNGFPS